MAPQQAPVYLLLSIHLKGSRFAIEIPRPITKLVNISEFFSSGCNSLLQVRFDIRVLDSGVGGLTRIVFQVEKLNYVDFLDHMPPPAKAGRVRLTWENQLP